jgi:hypothetical protein
MEATSYSETSIYNKPLRATSRKTAFFTASAVKTPNPTLLIDSLIDSKKVTRDRLQDRSTDRKIILKWILSRPPLWSSGQSSRLQIQRSGFDSRPYHIFWEVVGLERGPLSLVSTTEQLLETNGSGSGLENRDYGRRDSSRWPPGILYPQKLALTLLTPGFRSVGIVRSQTQATEFSFWWRVNRSWRSRAWVKASRIPHFSENRLTDGGEVVRFTRVPPLPPWKAPATHFCQRLIRCQRHSAAGRISSIEMSTDFIGSRIRYLRLAAQCYCVSSRLIIPWQVPEVY